MKKTLLLLGLLALTATSGTFAKAPDMEKPMMHNTEIQAPVVKQDINNNNFKNINKPNRYDKKITTGRYNQHYNGKFNNYRPYNNVGYRPSHDRFHSHRYGHHGYRNMSHRPYHRSAYRGGRVPHRVYR